MNSLAQMERRLIGKNIYIVSLIVLISICIVGFMSGNREYWNIISFEIMFPIYATIASIEWAKAKSDPVYEVIKSINHSLFRWYINRVLIIQSIILAYVIVGLIYMRILFDFSVVEMIFIYISTTVFWVTVGALFIVLNENINVSLSCTCCFWIITLLTKGLLRFNVLRYFYPLIRYGGISTNVWILNKVVLLAFSFIIWIIIYGLGKKRFD